MGTDDMATELLTSLQKLSKTVESRQTADSVKGVFFVLNYLYERGSVALPGEISTAMEVSSARIAMLLNSLDDRGLIERFIDSEDRRRIDVRLTTAGEKLVKEKRRQIHEAFVELVEKIGEEDIRNYIRITDRIISASASR